MSIKSLLGYPWTWVALLINLGGAIGLGLWFQTDSPAVATGMGIGVFLFGALSWLLLGLRSNDLRDHLDRLDQASQQSDLEGLRVDLDRLDSNQGLTQLSQFSEKLDAFVDVLKLRFRSDELTYRRYEQTARMVHAGGIQNLRNLRAALESIKTIDIKSLESRLAQLTDADAERPTLLRRRALHTEQQAKAERLLVENEEAITALTNVTTALANTDTESNLETGHAIEALEALAKRTDRYAASS